MFQKVLPTYFHWSFMLMFFCSIVGNAAPDDDEKEIGYVVIGVIASTKTNAGFVLLKEKSTGKVLTKMEGSKVKGGIVISKVATRWVTFSLNNKNYEIEVGSDSARSLASETSKDSESPQLSLDQGLEKVGNELRVEASLKEALVSNQLQNILMQAAMEPFLENGVVRGFKIWAIENGSIFQKAGFKDGDLITHINGLPLKDAISAINTLKSLKNATEVEVTFESDGSAPQNLKIIVQ